jgi:hypothetical protein
MRFPPLALGCCLTALAACGADGDDPILAPELGSGDGTPGSVTFTVIAAAADGLDEPRDLAFNPLRPDELWIVNHADDSVVLVFDAPAAERTFEKRIDGYALHFMAEVTGIAFGGDETTIGLPGTFATCGESRNTYDGQAPGNDFMGPTLWSSDLSVFAAQNPNGLGSHLDMLHNTPLCMGIAHESENRYWVVNGLIGAIDRYDFARDDGIGNDEHGDGLTWRYAVGELGYQPGVPSHLVLDRDSGMLYVADPANSRIARLDTAAGTEGSLVNGLETQVRMMNGAVTEDLVPAASGLVEAPAGIELAGEVLFVGDAASGRLSAFDLEGQLLRQLDTGLPANALAGITLGPDGRIYLVDQVGDRVLRVDPPPAP